MNIQDELQSVADEIQTLRQIFQEAESEITGKSDLGLKDLRRYRDLMETVQIKIQALNDKLQAIQNQATVFHLPRKLGEPARAGT